MGPRSRAAPHSQLIQYSDSVVRPVFTNVYCQITIVSACNLVGFEAQIVNSPQVAAFHCDRSLSDTSLCLVPHTRAPCRRWGQAARPKPVLNLPGITNWRELCRLISQDKMRVILTSPGLACIFSPNKPFSANAEFYTFPIFYLGPSPP